MGRVVDRDKLISPTVQVFSLSLSIYIVQIVAMTIWSMEFSSYFIPLVLISMLCFLLHFICLYLFDSGLNFLNNSFTIMHVLAIKTKWELKTRERHFISKIRFIHPLYVQTEDLNILLISSQKWFIKTNSKV